MNPPSKYRNVKTTIGGEKFDSKREALRWLVLKDRVKHGEIVRLTRQPEFELIVKGKLICKYRADFQYYELRDAGAQVRHVVDDAKGFRTKDFVIKFKLAQALFPSIEWRTS